MANGTPITAYHHLQAPTKEVSGWRGLIRTSRTPLITEVYQLQKVNNKPYNEQADWGFPPSEGWGGRFLIMIEVKHLYKSFGDKEVLKDINTVFEDGKTNLIIGQSGAGKTVLMRSLTGLLDPTSGEVLYDGRNFVNMTKKEKILMRREMGMIFQGAALFDSLTVLENVRFPLDMFSDMTAQERDKRAMECLERVNLTGAEQKFPGEISGGMQKRVAIARAIVMNPKYLFCDEPNSGLDPKTSLVIDELLTSITREFNMTTIINTHDMNSVMGIGENILFIADGRKEWQGNKDSVISSRNKKLNDLVFASDLFKKVKSMEESKTTL